jgi:hypothetical protein
MPDSPAQLPLDELIVNGLSVLSDEEICLLATNPRWVRVVSQKIWDSLAEGKGGDFWINAAIRVADSADAAKRTKRKLD